MPLALPSWMATIVLKFFEVVLNPDFSTASVISAKALEIDTPMPAFIRDIKYVNAAADPMGILPVIQKVILT